MLKYLFAAIIFVILDMTYLNISKSYFGNQIRRVQGADVALKIIPTAITYVILIFGLSYFILQKNGSVKDAAALGFFVYAVYELTNYSIFQNWSIVSVIIDILWGTILFGGTTWATYSLLSLFGIHKR